PSELSPASSSLDRAYLLRSATPSQSSSGPAPSIPQTQAYASLVIGRTTPTGEKSALASRLKSDDFPLPVPPARTTTVWPADSRSRSPARASRSSDSRSSSGSNPSWPLRADPILVMRARAVSRSDRAAPPGVPSGVNPGPAKPARGNPAVVSSSPDSASPARGDSTSVTASPRGRRLPGTAAGRHPRREPRPH